MCLYRFQDAQQAQEEGENDTPATGASIFRVGSHGTDCVPWAFAW